MEKIEESCKIIYKDYTEKIISKISENSEINCNDINSLIALLNYCFQKKNNFFMSHNSIDFYCPLPFTGSGQGLFMIIQQEQHECYLYKYPEYKQQYQRYPRGKQRMSAHQNFRDQPF